MQSILKPLRALSRPVFLLGALLYVPVALILGFLVPKDLEQYSLLIISLDSLTRALLFFGVLALLARHMEESGVFAAIGIVLVALGTLSGLIFSIGTLGEYGGIIDRPTWVTILIPMMLSGFIGTLLAGVVSFRSRMIPNQIGFLLFAPTIIFALQLGLMPLFPTWVVLLFIGAQAATMLAIGLQLPAEQHSSKAGTPQPSTA